MWVWNDNFPPLNLWNYSLTKTVCGVCHGKGGGYDSGWWYECGACMPKLAPTDMALGTVKPPDTTTKTVNANAIQYGGTHYKNKAIQPWDYIHSNNIGFLEGSIIKYVSRYQDKNGLEDLKKAMHFLEKLIEVQTKELNATE